MPSKNMIRKGKRRQSVKGEYRLHRDAVREQAASGELGTTPQGGQQPVAERVSGAEPQAAGSLPDAQPAKRGLRLDAYLSRTMPDISRSRIQTMIAAGQVTLDGEPTQASTMLRGDEDIEVLGEPQLPPIKGEPEDIPLSIVFEDEDLAVIDKPAGMMVHAGSGSAEHNRGTLVNALLFHFGKQLSATGGDLRPGIVHRLDKDTSGLILIAKNDRSHKGLSEQFSERTLRKTYVALVHGSIAKDTGTIDLPISRDLVRRTRMTTRRSEGRHAITHWRVLERLHTAFGAFTLTELRIETGRTHQIRVHLKALGHPVAGDTVYGAPAIIRALPAKGEPATEEFALGRNFLHAAELELEHPLSGEPLHFAAPLPRELDAVLSRLRGATSSRPQ